MFKSVRARRLLAIAGTSLLPLTALVASPVEAAERSPGYSFSFKVLASHDNYDGNVLQGRINCPAGEALELAAVTVGLDKSDPAYDPNAVPGTGATIHDRFPLTAPVVLECAGKPRTYRFELFPSVEGYDLPGDGPCIGYCYYHVSPLLQARQKVNVSYAALTSDGTWLTGVSKTRVRK